MTKEGEFNNAISSVITRLQNIQYTGDLSDIGNEIGLAIGDRITSDMMGFDKEDFIHGFNHGISIIDGTH